MSAPAREWQKLACAAVLGAIVAFPAGVMFSGRKSVQSEARGSGTITAPSVQNTEVLNPYRPNILSDPYVVRRHRQIVEALENYCRKSGKDCVEAKEARRYLDDREAARARQR